MDDYSNKIEQQVDQYKNEEIHNLPNFFHYWSNSFLLPRFKQVMGAESIADLYARNFSETLEKGLNNNLLSVGSGDCSVEIEVVRNLLARQHKVW